MSDAAASAATATPFDAIVITASFGGPQALTCLLGDLPADFPVPILLVQHLTPAAEDYLVRILCRRSRLPVRAATDGEPMSRGGVMVLPAQHAGQVDPTGRLRLVPSAGIRPADALISSVAERYGPRALCVVLTGRLDDGTVGVRELKRHGGHTIVEDPATARAPGMPSAALATGCVDLVMPLDQIGAALTALTMGPRAGDLFHIPASFWADLAA